MLTNEMINREINLLIPLLEYTVVTNGFNTRSLHSKTDQMRKGVSKKDPVSLFDSKINELLILHKIAVVRFLKHALTLYHIFLAKDRTILHEIQITPYKICCYSWFCLELGNPGLLLMHLSSLARIQPIQYSCSDNCSAARAYWHRPSFVRKRSVR